jgi:hypothetical protein
LINHPQNHQSLYDNTSYLLDCLFQFNSLEKEAVLIGDIPLPISKWLSMLDLDIYQFQHIFAKIFKLF